MQVARAQFARWTQAMNKRTVIILLSAILLNVWIAVAATPDLTIDAVTTLTSRVDNLTLTIGISPITTNYGLRSVTLYVSKTLRVEPHAMWPNGKPVTAAALISATEAIHTVSIVADSGLFKRAYKFYSERTAITTNTPPPPSGARDMRYFDSEATGSPCISIKYVVFDEYWYSYYKIAVPWDNTTRRILNNICAAISGEGHRLIESLKIQMECVPPPPALKTQAPQIPEE